MGCAIRAAAILTIPVSEQASLNGEKYVKRYLLACSWFTRRVRADKIRLEGGPLLASPCSRRGHNDSYPVLIRVCAYSMTRFAWLFHPSNEGPPPHSHYGNIQPAVSTGRILPLQTWQASHPAGTLTGSLFLRAFGAGGIHQSCDCSALPFCRALRHGPKNRPGGLQRD